MADSNNFGPRRFHTLDGLRGTAAIVVLCDHSWAWLSPIPRPRGWLAVDLFFALSGFVIAKAYDDRFAKGMSAQQFVVLRYIRLYPLYLVGITIGIASAVLARVAGHAGMTVPQLTVSAISGLMMLPSPTWNSIADLVPFDHPAWSLVFELGINVVFACAWHWLNNRTVAIVVALSAIALEACYCFGDGAAGPGWSQAWMGIPRVSFGFFLGVLIARHYHPDCATTPLAWAVPLALIPMLFFIPYADVSAKAVDAFCVFGAFPALIIIGARFEPRDTRWMAALGLISYPLYAVHEPVLYFLWRIVLAVHLSPERLAPMGGILFIAAMLWASWGLAKADERIQGIIKARRHWQPRGGRASTT